MIPKEFDEQSDVLRRPTDMTDEECKSLPIFTDGKECISLWKASWKERLHLLFRGTIWLRVRSGKTQPAVALNGYKSAFKK